MDLVFFVTCAIPMFFPKTASGRVSMAAMTFAKPTAYGFLKPLFFLIVPVTLVYIDAALLGCYQETNHNRKGPKGNPKIHPQKSFNRIQKVKTQTIFGFVIFTHACCEDLWSHSLPISIFVPVTLISRPNIGLPKSANAKTFNQTKNKLEGSKMSKGNTIVRFTRKHIVH